MVESIGKKLLHARQARGLTLEEAAMETRIRASQLAALEADDYSGFANNTYARGFLLMYGKFLNVEVRAFARELETGNPISVSDYQYLNASQEDEVRTPVRRSSSSNRTARDERQRPSFMPLIVFVVLLGLVGFGSYLYMQAKRLEEAMPSTANAATPAPAADKTAPAPAPAPAPAAPGPTTTLSARPGVQPTPVPAPAAVQPTPIPTAQGDPTRIGVPTATLPATPVPTFRVDPASGAAVQNELVVEPLKKTWVRIRRDDPTAEPVYDDVVYPKVGPLKVKGSRFWVEVKEADAVMIRKNGQPLAYQPPGIAIQ